MKKYLKNMSEKVTNIKGRQKKLEQEFLKKETNQRKSPEY